MMDAYINHEFVPLERASLHISDLSIQRGFGVFDFFRIKDGVPLFLDHYLNRFFNSIKILGLQDAPGRDDLQEVITELIARNGMSDAGIKLIFTGGYSPDAYQPTSGNLIVSQHVLKLPTMEQLSKGIRIITHPYRRELAEVKTINYITGVWLQTKLKERKADDVLYHFNHEVSEFPRCNFFGVTKKDELVTPGNHVLHGITRRNVLDVARNRFEVAERTVTMADLAEVKEAFLTSTTKGILPIVEVDGRPVGNGKPGRITMELHAMLLQKEREALELNHQNR